MITMSDGTAKATVAAGTTATALHVVASSPIGPTLSLLYFI